MTIVPQSDSPDHIRQVLNAPRGQRFVRPRSPHRPTNPDSASHTNRPEKRTREQRLLAQMRDNPRVAYRLEHGELPPWMHIQSDRVLQAQASRSAHTTRPDSTEPTQASRLTQASRQPAPHVPRPRPAPDDTPRQPLPPRPRRHRKPRRRVSWTLTGYGLAALAGALARHLTTALL